MNKNTKIKIADKNFNNAELAGLINSTRKKGDFMYTEPPVTADGVFSMLRNKNVKLFIAYLDNEAVGFCLVVKRGTKEIKHIVKIQAISVIPAFRNKKIGSQLLERVLIWAKKHKASLVSLDVINANKFAMKLYTNNGFIKGGEIPNAFLRNKKMYSLVSLYRIL